MAQTGCSEFDATPNTSAGGTLGEEIYKVVCERMATEVWPTDVMGNRSRELCRGDAPPSTAPDGTRLQALAENRDRLVAALDHTLPEDLEDELQTLLLGMLPFYDPPAELFPSNTRAIADVLGGLMASDDVKAALAQISNRRGLRPQRLAVGITRPILSYGALNDLSQSVLSLVADGAPLEDEWTAVLEAGALEMATCEPSPPDDPTLGLVRDFLLRSDVAFGSDTPRYIVARDTRGLPIPAFLDGSEGFVDLDTDGLADADAAGRFLAADGSLLNPPTPFAVIDETGVTRDAAGRAMTATDQPLYVYQDVERSILAALLREAPQLLDPANPVLLDLMYGMGPVLGADVPKEEAYGALTVPFDGFASESGALFDLVYALADMITYDETRDVLSITQTLIEDHENELVPLIESGLFGDALGDQYPDVDLVAGSELWDDVIRVATWMSETPGLLEALLRSFNTPDAKRLGPIFAEMMRFKDVPLLNPADENQILADEYWTVPVDRSLPDSSTNSSLFQQTLAGIHELNGVPLCNKEGARAIVDLDVLGAGLGMDFGWLEDTAAFFGLNWSDGLDITSLGEFLGLADLGPWGECELIRIDNSAQAFARAVIGRQELVMDLGFITQLIDLLNLNATVDALLPVISGIDGFDTTPTPTALARLMFGTPNHFINGLIDPPATKDGDVFRDRFSGNMVLAWERVFRFCGDRILDEGEDTCATGPIETVSLYDALSPLITVLDDMDPLVDDDNDPNTPPRFLFGELVSSFHMHYPTASNPMFQGTNPTGAHYAHTDRGVTYEPIVADLMAGCRWVPAASGANGRTCTTADTGRLISRLGRVTALLDSIETTPGVDGMDVAGAALERFLNPALNPGLTNRAGATTTQTNSGSRTIPMTPLHLVLDALNRMDDAHDTDATRSAAWYAARSSLVDIFIKTEPLANDQFRFENRRLYAVLTNLVDFAMALIDSHVTDGDLETWAHTLDADLEDSIAGAMGAGTIRFLDASHAHPEMQAELLALFGYLVDEKAPNEAFENTLYSMADSLYLLEDDGSAITLLNAFSNALATDASAAVAGAGTLAGEGSVADELVNLLSAVSGIDTAETLPLVLRNSVTHPPGELETPIEVIADVIAEVNRAAPNAGGPLAPDDYGAVMGQTEDFLIDDERGLERVYSIVQSRELN